MEFSELPQGQDFVPVDLEECPAGVDVAPTLGDPRSQRQLVERDCPIEIGDGDPDMIEADAASSICRALRCGVLRCGALGRRFPPRSSNEKLLQVLGQLGVRIVFTTRQRSFDG